jgi:quercetin dioxygenase-like cupin family protein
MELKRAGSQPSAKGPAQWFTGTVRIDPLNAPPGPARHSCAAVTFEPGARSNWHTHPRGKRSSSHWASAGRSAKANRRWRSARAM